MESKYITEKTSTLSTLSLLLARLHEDIKQEDYHFTVLPQKFKSNQVFWKPNRSNCSNCFSIYKNFENIHCKCSLLNFHNLFFLRINSGPSWIFKNHPNYFLFFRISAILSQLNSFFLLLYKIMIHKLLFNQEKMERIIFFFLFFFKKTQNGTKTTKVEPLIISLFFRQHHCP